VRGYRGSKERRRQIAQGVTPGKIILSNPHLNISGQTGMGWVVDSVWGDNARRWGWTERMITEERKLIQTEGDLDGPEPDWALARAMLSYAYKQATK
jgi:hypothetical protein